MKFTFSQLLIALILTGISYSKATKAQGVLDKRVTVSLNNVSLEDALKTIEQGYNVKFIYNENLVDNKLRLSYAVKNEELKKILDKLSTNYGITYEVVNNSIVLHPSATNVVKASASDAGDVNAAAITVSGTVTDEKGESIPGVTVTVKGTQLGVVTDKDGKYKLGIENNNYANGSLVFSFIGYNTQEVPISGRTIINIQLVGASQSLNEVVVVAYGSTKKRDLTGSVSTISASDIEKTPSLSPQQAMQGRMAGVQVSTAGGDPNDAPTVRIRGVTTFSGQNADPLYVVDGVVIDEYGSRSTFSVSQQKASDIMGTQNIFNLINPNDIESISVLKDASSAAAYGARAANGVILITTKKGREGKAVVNVTAQGGVSNLPKTLDVLNTQQYAAIENEANAGNPNFTGPVYDVYNPSSPAYLGNGPTIDWQKALENKNAPFQDYDMSISGGNSNSNYYVGGGYANDQSDLKFNQQQRYSFSTRTEFKINKFFEVGETLRLAYTDLNDGRDPTGVAANMYDVRRAAPWQPIYDPNGYDGFASALPNTYGEVTENFFAIPSVESQTFGTMKTLGNAYATIIPVKNLRITGTVGMDYTTLRRLTTATDSVALFNTNGSSVGNTIEDLNSVNFSLTTRMNVDYAFKFGKSSLDLYAHAEEQKVNYHAAIAAEAGITGIVDPYLFEADGGMLSNGTTYKDRTAYLNYLARANYKYDDKYYLDVTVLRQGTSIFNPDGYQFGTFPSVAGAWRISSEDFMKGSAFDDLKIKAGVGQLGNSDTQAFQYLSLVQNTFATYLVNGVPTIGAFFSNYPNADLTWEHITTYNVGFEGTYKKNLTFSAEYYDRVTSGILQAYALPASAGLTTDPYKNIGAATNKGVELTANYQNRIGDFSYNAGFNITTTANKVTKLDNNLPVSTPGGFVVLGDPIGSIYGYKTAGVIKTEAQLQAYQAKYAGSQYVSSLQLGDLMYQDVGSAPTAADVAAGRQYHAGANGSIDGYDGLVKLGKTIPGYFYGINLGGAYKSFDLSILFSGVGDVQKVNTIKEDGVTYGLDNQLSTVLDHWSPSNPNSNNPRAIAYGPSAANDGLFSNRFVESAAYLRLSNAQIGYTIPNSILAINKVFSRVRVFLSGSNLFLVTKYTGYDPDNDLVPPARTVLVGLNLSM